MQGHSVDSHGKAQQNGNICHPSSPTADMIDLDEILNNDTKKQM